MVKRKKTSPRKARQSVEDTDKRQWAKDWLEPLKLGRAPASFENLAERYNRNPAVIARGIRVAFKDKLVEVVDTEKSPIVTDSVLENALREKFDDLRTATVIRLPDAAPAKAGTSQREADDQIHRQLGRAVAEVLARNQFIFGTSPCIGVSSGRGVYYTVDSLKHHLPLKGSDVRVLSLSGLLLAKAHFMDPAKTMDADDNAAALASCFEEAEFRKISHPLGYTPDELGRARDRTWFSKWEEYHPTHALLGVGVLAEGHRFVEYSRKGDEKTLNHDVLQYVAPIHDDLKGLVDACEAISSSAYCPVADIANHLFFVSPPSGINIDKAKQKRIEDRIGKINRCLLNVSAEDLKKIGTMILVAGTKRKAFAIRTLLSTYKKNIQYLATDSETAKLLLEKA